MTDDSMTGTEADASNPPPICPLLDSLHLSQILLRCCKHLCITCELQTSFNTSCASVSTTESCKKWKKTGSICHLGDHGWIEGIVKALTAENICAHGSTTRYPPELTLVKRSLVQLSLFCSGCTALFCQPLSGLPPQMLASYHLVYLHHHVCPLRVDRTDLIVPLSVQLIHQTLPQRQCNAGELAAQQIQYYHKSPF